MAFSIMRQPIGSPPAAWLDWTVAPSGSTSRPSCARWRAASASSTFSFASSLADAACSHAAAPRVAPASLVSFGIAGSCTVLCASIVMLCSWFVSAHEL